MKKKAKIKKKTQKKVSSKKAPAEVRFAAAAGMAGLGGPLNQF